MNVVGISRGTSSKTNKVYTVLHVIGDFDEFKAKFSEGNSAESIYVPKRVNVSIGDDIDVVYGVGFDGKAIVRDVTVIKGTKVS